MHKIQYGVSDLLVDTDLTRRIYQSIRYGSAADCACPDCQRFAQAREIAFPQSVRMLLNRLGVDFTKEAELLYDGRSHSGSHIYSGWFHCVGHLAGNSNRTVVLKDELTTAYRLDLEQIEPHFWLGFTERHGFYWPEFQGQPLLQIEFMVEVP